MRSLHVLHSHTAALANAEPSGHPCRPPTRLLPLRLPCLLSYLAAPPLPPASAAPGKYPGLSPAQQHKLKLLTSGSAADGVRTLGYAALMTRLELPSVRGLEDMLITDCFYAGLLKGKLDQKNRCGCWVLGARWGGARVLAAPHANCLLE